MVNRVLVVILIHTVAGLATHAAEVVTNLPGQTAGRPAARTINPLTGFVAGSLSDVVWAGFHTNGRTTNMWEFTQVPLGWPLRPPVLRWNTNNLMWDRKGMTAICQIWEGMGSFGQVTVTALTRRHGYLRGHSVGPNGLNPKRVGQRIWFCTRDNQVIERKVQLFLTRYYDEGHQRDYSIVLFDADLPPGIEPMRVAEVLKVNRKYLSAHLYHTPVLITLQGGYVSAGIQGSSFSSGGVPGWMIPFRGGDSGAPFMLPLPDELVFFGGLTTSAPTPEMQADMDLLSRQAGLDPSKYQMQWVDLDGYPNP